MIENDYPYDGNPREDGTNAMLVEILERLGRIETKVSKLASDVNDIERDMETKVPYIGVATERLVIDAERWTEGDVVDGLIDGLPESMQKHAHAHPDKPYIDDPLSGPEIL